MSDVPPIIPGSKLYETLKVINGTKITKATINSLVELNQWKGLVDVATTGNIVFLSGDKVVDGQAVSEGSIVLVKNQTNAVQNGIYTVKSNSAWLRSNLLRNGSYAAGIAVFVKSGSTNLNKVFVCTNEYTESIVGTNDLVFESVVLNYNDIVGINGGIIYNDNSNFGVGLGITDGSGNLDLVGLKSNGNVSAGLDITSDEFSFNSVAKRIYNNSGVITFENGADVLELNSNFKSNVPLVSNLYSFSGNTQISISYTDGQITINDATFTRDGLDSSIPYYSGSNQSLSYNKSGTTSGIQNTGNNDISFVVSGSETMKVDPNYVSNNIDVVAPNLLFDNDFTFSITQQGPKLVGTTSFTDSSQAYSVSVYGDTLVMGGPTEDNSQGAAWVFTRTAGVWTQQGSKLVGSGATGTALQGISVSIYEDTIAIGGLNDDSGIGAVWIFTRTAGVWSQQGSKLVPNDYTGSTINFGQSVSLYGDTLVVGGSGDDSNVGAAWVFTRTAGVWTQQGSKLVGSGSVGNANQGFSVSLFEDTLAMGGLNDDSTIGAAWVFTRTAGVWTQQGSKIVGNDTTGNANQGFSVSVYQDTLVVGGPGNNTSEGAVWVYNRSSDIWTQETILVPSGGDYGSIGKSVYVYNGLLAVGGNTLDNIGATWVYKKNLGNWTQLGPRLEGSGYVGTPLQGTSVSVYGETIVTGGYNDDEGLGAAWVFLYDPLVVSNASGILFDNNVGFYINGNIYMDFNTNKTISYVPITSNTNEYNFSSTQNITSSGDVLSFKTNNTNVLNVSDTQVSTSLSLKSDSYSLNGFEISNDSGNVIIHNTDTSLTISSTAITSSENVYTNGYAFNTTDYIRHTNNSITFSIETTLSMSLTPTSMNTSLPFISGSNIKSNMLGTSKTYNVSNSNNSLELGGGLYTLKGSVSNFATAAWIDINLQTCYLVSGYIETNVPITFRIQRFIGTTITNIQGTYSTYFTLTGTKLYFNSNYSNYSFNVLVTKSTTPFTYTVPLSYLLVGGGGSGKNGGGGGGGVTSDSSISLQSSTVLTISVGGGGIGSNGYNTDLSGTNGFVTATGIGGGRGGLVPGGNGIGGATGGGGAARTSGGAGGTGGTATQGFAGGNGANTAGATGSGGGGGAVSAGVSGSANAGGNGGTGVSNSITGSAVVYGGGGGGGGSSSGGTGGPGGGGNGSTAAVGSGGTDNLGGGGGGGTGTGSGYSQGGSGIAILRIPTAYYSSMIEAISGPTDYSVATTGSDTVISFKTIGANVSVYTYTV